MALTVSVFITTACFSTVATAPTLDSLVHIAPTAVRVTWSPPSETSITGYRVRYSLSGGSVTMTDIMSSTTRDISGLTNGETYTFSVEVITSNMLPGVSEEMTITLGEWLQLQFTLTIPFLSL